MALDGGANPKFITLSSIYYHNTLHLISIPLNLLSSNGKFLSLSEIYLGLSFNLNFNIGSLKLIPLSYLGL